MKVFGKTRAIGIGCSLKRKLNTCQSSSSVSWTLIGEPRSVKFYHLSLASIFFWTYFYRSCGWGMAHLDPLLVWPIPGSARCVRSTSSRFTRPSGKERIQNTLTIHASKSYLFPRFHSSAVTSPEYLLFFLACPFSADSSFITSRKRSLGQGNAFTPVCHSVPWGGCIPGCNGHRWCLLGGICPGDVWPGGWCLLPRGVSTPHSPEMATEAGGTQPTGMHSCSSFFLGGITQLSQIPFDWLFWSYCTTKQYLVKRRGGKNDIVELQMCKRSRQNRC